ncbi:hypothetical protein FQZ97_921020 [compost metagenome]
MRRKLADVFRGGLAQLAQTGREAHPEIRVAGGLELGLHPQQETVVLAVVRGVVLEHAGFHLRPRFAVLEDGPHIGHHALVVALEQLQEQFGLAAEIGIERAARVPRLFGDVLDAGGHEPLG